jgi:hypothetical protein
MWSWFKRSKNKGLQVEEIALKSINFPAKIILLWAKAIEGDKEVQLWLRENGYQALFHATNAIYLIEPSRNWLMENGYAHLMAMINASEGLVTAQEWLAKHNMELLFHVGRAVDHEQESWQWLTRNAPPDLVILTKYIQYVKDQIEENHNDIHSFGKDI